MDKRLHAVVSGRVQGVGFRNFVEFRAMALDLSGWVRNLYSGEVEVLAEGNENALSFFLSDLEKGPSSARVIDVQVEWLPSTGEFDGFDIRTTWVTD
jgi:acylphosphatase